MKKVLVVLTFLTFVFTGNLIASDKDHKGASDVAYENANDHSIFKRVGNWFGEIGKSDEEKEARKAARDEEKNAEKKAKALKQAAKEKKNASEEEAEQMRKKVKHEKIKNGDTMKGSYKGSMKDK